MRLFHGSPRKFDSFVTPTGLSEMDVTKGGVVYLTEDRDVASRYAGKDGYVYTVESSNARSYAEQRKLQNLKKKKGKYTRGVWVCLPQDCRITSVSAA